MEASLEKQAEQPKTSKFRHRKKNFYNTIRRQMEFYFGDANLGRDRYLMQLVKTSPDGYVSLDEFLKFNKIKALTEKVEDIRKALGNSTLLQLSPDEKQVKRVTEVQKKEDIDDCTIYIQNLPRTTTHDYLKEVFSRYGNITYVSLPRYKISRKIKEFGFVEFESKESVERALNAFRVFGGVLQYQDQDPSTLVSVTSYQQEKEEVEAESQKDPETEESEEPPSKRLKTDENVDQTNNPEGEEESDVPEEAPGEAEGTKEKKKKKKKSKTGKNEDKMLDMKIMSKREWKRLRNKYLNLQWQKLKEIKQKLQAGKKKQEPKQKPPSAVKIKTSPRKINFYGAMQDRKSGSEDNVEEVPAAPKKPLFSFEPGLIVSLRFQVPCVDVKDFKEEVKQFAFVKYVDVKEGDLEAFVRVDKVASANQLVKFYSATQYQPQILSGEREQQYWQKMLEDREKKLNKTVKLKRPRGREKLTKKIAQHVRFDD